MDPSPKSPISCIVADDHALLRKALVELLRHEPDIQVIGEAADGEEVLAQVGRRHPDAVVLDAMMPGLGGVDVCIELAAIAPEVAVVLYTGSGELDLLERALDAGAKGFVLKSGHPSDVARALRVAHAGQVYVDASMAGALLNRRFERPERVLSDREHEVVALLAEGHTTDETAAILFLSPATVRTYAENAMHKLEARNRPHLIAKYVRLGLLG
jgi:DNA-binding NarL/FixJ family response regulator